MQSKNGIKNDYGKNGKDLFDFLDRDNLNHDLDNMFQIIFPNLNWEECIEQLLK